MGTVRDFTAMNALAEKYGDKINILAFPCNQFGHQTNEGNSEFLNTIKYVRPGDGFEIDPSITVFEKTDVNGASAHPLFKWMKNEIMIPVGDGGDGCIVDTQENGCADADALILPRGGWWHDRHLVEPSLALRYRMEFREVPTRQGWQYGEPLPPLLPDWRHLERTRRAFVDGPRGADFGGAAALRHVGDRRRPLYRSRESPLPAPRKAE